MKTTTRLTAHRILAFFAARRGYKRPSQRAFPEGDRYVAAGAYPVRRAVRLR